MSSVSENGESSSRIEDHVVPPVGGQASYAALAYGAGLLGGQAFCDGLTGFLVGRNTDLLAPRIHRAIDCDRSVFGATYENPNAAYLAVKTWNTQLYSIAVILLILWMLGLVSSYTMGGFIHILLVIAVIMVILRIINGRKVV